jgi:hypothetical protein
MNAAELLRKFQGKFSTTASFEELAGFLASASHDEVAKSLESVTCPVQGTYPGESSKGDLSIERDKC